MHSDQKQNDIFNNNGDILGERSCIRLNKCSFDIPSCMSKILEPTPKVTTKRTTLSGSHIYYREPTTRSLLYNF